LDQAGKYWERGRLARNEREARSGLGLNFETRARGVRSPY